MRTVPLRLKAEQALLKAKAATKRTEVMQALEELCSVILHDKRRKVTSATGQLVLDLHAQDNLSIPAIAAQTALSAPTVRKIIKASKKTAGGAL